MEVSCEHLVPTPNEVQMKIKIAPTIDLIPDDGGKSWFQSFKAP